MQSPWGMVLAKWCIVVGGVVCVSVATTYFSHVRELESRMDAIHQQQQNMISSNSTKVGMEHTLMHRMKREATDATSREVYAARLVVMPYGNRRNRHANELIMHGDGNPTAVSSIIFGFQEDADNPILSQKRWDGYVTVRENALYQLYAHVTYQSSKLVHGYSITINGVPFVSCLQQKLWRHQHSAGVSCDVEGVTYLHEGDTLELVWMYNRRAVMTDPHLTYWGVVMMV